MFLWECLRRDEIKQCQMHAVVAEGGIACSVTTVLQNKAGLTCSTPHSSISSFCHQHQLSQASPFTEPLPDSCKKTAAAKIVCLCSLHSGF